MKWSIGLGARGTGRGQEDASVDVADSAGYSLWGQVGMQLRRAEPETR